MFNYSQDQQHFIKLINEAIGKDLTEGESKLMQIIDRLLCGSDEQAILEMQDYLEFKDGYPEYA